MTVWISQRTIRWILGISGLAIASLAIAVPGAVPETVGSELYWTVVAISSSTFGAVGFLCVGLAIWPRLLKGPWLFYTGMAMVMVAVGLIGVVRLAVGGHRLTGEQWSYEWLLIALFALMAAFDFGRALSRRKKRKADAVE